MALTVDIAVFAHDEGAGIAAMVAGLAAQDILHGPDFAARVLVLANGCRDDTAARARAVAVAGIEVVELADGRQGPHLEPLCSRSVAARGRYPDLCRC